MFLQVLFGAEGFSFVWFLLMSFFPKSFGEEFLGLTCDMTNDLCGDHAMYFIRVLAVMGLGYSAFNFAALLSNDKAFHSVVAAVDAVISGLIFLLCVMYPAMPLAQFKLLFGAAPLAIVALLFFH